MVNVRAACMTSSSLFGTCLSVMGGELNIEDVYVGAEAG